MKVCIDCDGMANEVGQYKLNRAPKHVDYVLIWHEDQRRTTTCACWWLREITTVRTAEGQRAGNRVGKYVQGWPEVQGSGGTELRDGR